MKKTKIVTRDDYIYNTLKRLMSYKEVKISKDINLSVLTDIVNKLSRNGNNVVLDSKNLVLKMNDSIPRFTIFKNSK